MVLETVTAQKHPILVSKHNSFPKETQGSSEGGMIPGLGKEENKTSLERFLYTGK